MSTTTTTRDRGDRYGPIEWAQLNHNTKYSQILRFSHLAWKWARPILQPIAPRGYSQPAYIHQTNSIIYTYHFNQFYSKFYLLRPVTKTACSNFFNSLHNTYSGAQKTKAWQTASSKQINSIQFHWVHPWLGEHLRGSRSGWSRSPWSSWPATQHRTAQTPVSVHPPKPRSWGFSHTTLWPTTS